MSFLPTLLCAFMKRELDAMTDRLPRQRGSSPWPATATVAVAWSGKWLRPPLLATFLWPPQKSGLCEWTHIDMCVLYLTIFWWQPLTTKSSLCESSLTLIRQGLVEGQELNKPLDRELDVPLHWLLRLLGKCYQREQIILFVI